MVFLVTPVPGRPSGLAWARGEDDTWMLTLSGMAGNDPPDTFEELCDFAADLLPAYALAALRTATPARPTASIATRRAGGIATTDCAAYRTA